MTDHVLIAGGGIAGAAAAASLATAGLEVTVLERRPCDHEGGAVVRLNPNAMDALRAIDVHQPVIAASFPLLRSERWDAHGRVGVRLSADPTSPRGMARAMHWSRLSGALRTCAIDRGATFRHDRAVVGAAESADGVVVELDDSSSVSGDLLVGADGVGSPIRRVIDPGAPEPRRLGTRTVYGFAPEPGVEPPPPEVLRAQLGPRGFFAATRDSASGGCFWFTSLRAPETAPASVEALRAELMAVFADGPDPAATVIANSTRLLSFDDHALEHLPRWHSDRMVVIGDAAHVAPPASESGAAMAIEDGVLLGRQVRDQPTPAAAFAAFERDRRARVEAVVALGLAGTSRVHQKGLRSRLRAWRDHARSLVDWQRRPPIGGPPWLLDHHISWEPSCPPRP